MNILHVDSSARYSDSISRKLTQKIVEQLNGGVIRRDLAEGLPVIDEAWVKANFTAAEDRSEEQKARLALSDTLVGEIQAASTIVIGAPIYNFGLPAGLKLWIDLITRAKLTFRYSQNGPEGLITGKKIFIVMTSGGTPIGSDLDFASGYLRHVLAFNGMTDVTLIKADSLGSESDQKIANAVNQIEAIAA